MRAHVLESPEPKISPEQTLNVAPLRFGPLFKHPELGFTGFRV